MTKARAPLTPYRSLSQIADLLGWDGCAAVLGKSEWSVRKWADPDAEREISLQDAIRLDAAFMRAGGERAPLFECYAARLDLAGADDEDDEAQLLAATSIAAKEAGEAVSAALDAAASKDKAARLRAKKEAGEAIEALQSLFHRLKRGVRG